MMDRILALDYGDARIGVAVTDPLGMTAQPAGMIRHVGYGPDIRNLEKIADTYQTRRVVMGLPFNMDGTEGFQAQKVRAFAEQLEMHGFEVDFQDERMTSRLVESLMIADHVRRNDRKKHVDTLSAVTILQSYLDSRRGRFVTSGDKQPLFPDS